jgi:hypothetical protein
VTEYDGLTRAPILVVDLCAVFGGDRVHGLVSSVVDVVIFMILLDLVLIFGCQTSFCFQILVSLAFLGSPGITWAFFIGWFERGGKKTELLE